MKSRLTNNNRIVERLIKYYPASTIGDDVLKELVAKDSEIKHLRELLKRTLPMVSGAGCVTLTAEICKAIGDG